jgi:cytochrome P450
VQVDRTTDADRRRRFPVGASVSFDDLELAGREGVLDELRRHEPVSWVPALGGWLITSRACARALLSSSATTVEAQQNLVRASLGVMMLTTDDEEHARLRKPFEPPFRISTVEGTFAEVIASEAAELLDGLLADGGCELGEQFAAPFAVRMAGRMLGISLDDVAQINEFYSAFAGAMVYDGDPNPQLRADVAREKLNRILQAEVERSRVEGGGSITALVASAGDVGVGALTDDEIVAQLRVVMFGAIETVQASIMNTLLLLLLSPAQLAVVRNDLSLITAAGEEARRLVPPVSFVERWTRTSVDIGGVNIPPREFVGVSILAANRDPDTFDDPATFDVRRRNASRALTFSFGQHACLGLHAARLETQIALEQVLTRCPGLQLAGYEPPAGFAFRRPQSMNVNWEV